MLRDITFGQFFQTDSAIHSLDPRMKIVLLIASIVFIFLSGNFYSLFAVLAFVISAVFLSKVPLRMYFKNIKAVLFIVAFTAVLNILYTHEGKLLLSFWKIKITTGGLYTAAYLALRIILLITVSSVLTYTTTPNDLTDAIERLCTPLKFVGLKKGVHTMALMMTIALRFIPTLVEETEKIMNAQKARGADLENGSPAKRIKALVPILIPLFISAVRRSYELAEAMECRCYNGGEGRRRMKKLKMRACDAVAFVFTAFMCVSVILMNTYLG